MKAAAYGMVLAFSLVGCTSVRAPQLEYLLNTFFGQGADVRAELEASSWVLSWLGDEERFFAGVAENATIFVSERESFVVFDGWNVVNTRGLLPGGGREDARIEIGPERKWLRFENAGIEAKRVACDSWSSQPLPGGGLLWSQRCDELQEPNEIEIDADGRMIAVQFIAHPDYPPVKLRFSGANPTRNR